jgi:hypothetical protein
MRAERIAWPAAALCLLLHAWLYRFEMINLDGISYLELAEAWRDGRWADAISSYWSPLYSWVLAVALLVADPAPYWEYPLVHAVNAGAGLAALAAFAYLVRGFRWTSGPPGGGHDGGGWRVAAAYALFTWSAVALIVVWMESPDMLLAAWTYLAFGALVRITMRTASRRTYAVLGAALGLGYLTKSAMLPLAGAFLAAALAVRPTEWRRLGLTVAVLAALSSPWIAVLSAAKGRPTAGDTARLNYLWFVNGSEDWPRNWPPHWPHFSGEEANGVAAHPARRLALDPAVYEFAAPIAGTYPMWYEPSWWYEGVRAYFDPVDQLRRIKISLADFYRLLALNPYNPEFFNPQPALLALLAFAAMATRRLTGVTALRPRWPLVLPSVAALAMYGLVYVEPRYVGACITALWVVAIDALTREASPPGVTLARLATSGMAIVTIAAVAAATWVDAYPEARRLLRGEPTAEHQAWATAERFRASGLRDGDRVAIAGNAQVATRWAHLLGVRMVAEVPAADAWKVVDSAYTRDDVAAAFAAAGAQWFVLEQAGGETPPGWQRVDGTPFLVQALR